MLGFVSTVSITALAGALAELRRARLEARTDPMTMLGNRRSYEEELSRLRKKGRQVGLILIDVANLKLANDQLGYAEGDTVIRKAATCLRQESDIAFRIGGDEFVVLLPGADQEGADLVARRIEDAFGVRTHDGVTTFLSAAAVETSSTTMNAAMALAQVSMSMRKKDQKEALGLPLTRAEAQDELDVRF